MYTPRKTILPVPTAADITILWAAVIAAAYTRAYLSHIWAASPWWGGRTTIAIIDTASAMMILISLAATLFYFVIPQKEQKNDN